MDDFPEDQARTVRNMQKATATAQGSVQRRQPLTKASDGWHIPDGATPPGMDDGGHLGASGGEPYWTEAGGSAYSLKPQPTPIAGFVANPTNTTSGAPATYSQSQIQAMVDTINSQDLQLTRCLNALKAAGLMSNF